MPPQEGIMANSIQCLMRLTALLLTFTMLGCFSERSFPANENQIKRLGADAPPAPEKISTRQWINKAHANLVSLLPAGKRKALSTDQLLDGDGSVMDVYAYMKLKPENLDSLFFNLAGIEQSAQVTSPEPADYCADWPGFESVCIKVTNGDQVCGRLAPPLKNDLGGSYIVITHGLFGAMCGLDVQNQVAALRNAGHHVLALEMRGHGATMVKFPTQTITFGVLEAPDLLAVSRYLKAERGAKRVGLVAFSLTAFAAMQAAWIDAGGLSEDRFGAMALFKDVPKPEKIPAFDAGMLLISPPVNFIETGETFEAERNALSGTVRSVFQKKAARRLELRGEKPTYKLWDFAASEMKLSILGERYPEPAALRKDCTTYFNLGENNWAEGRRRLESVRSPMLVLEAANDPLGTAQAVADLMGPLKNPNCGAIILSQGGHMGFPALSADYYYSLMLNYFDPKTGPAVQNRP
jgi:predicted alpha/beta-fold hydrolase